ncbi:MAG: DegT/DnrJ/EryC1/StrS family aminotransferase, partial [Pseudomonadota bacterium]
LRSVGVRPDDPVLTNAFTLAPVPGAIRAVGARPVLVEVTSDLVIDLEDLAAKARSSGARVLMLSHMRGHLADMDRLCALADAHGLTVLEDCAHTMGATWRGEKSGNFGVAACFSTQTYKHLNSGEGGFLTSANPALMARAVILSGSYMNYDRHGAVPAEHYFDDAKLDCPNMSARMDALRAAILRPQLTTLDQSVARWVKLAEIIEKGLSSNPAIRLPQAAGHAKRVGSSVQFRVPQFTDEQCRFLLTKTQSQGVELKWFGRPEAMGFTSAHSHWRYLDAQRLPQTDEVLATLFDMRLPLTFDENDCRFITSIISDAVANVSEMALA